MRVGEATGYCLGNLGGESGGALENTNLSLRSFLSG